MSELEDNYTNTLKNISNLQIAERDLYTQLERLSSSSNNANTDVTSQNDIIKKINDLSNTRIELFKNLAFNYRSIKQSAANSKYDLIDQITVLQMIEDQLNKSKQYINNIEASNMHQMRIVEINSYYSKRYSHHTNLIKILIVISIIVLLVILLKKYNIISQDVSNIIILIIIFVGLIILTVNGYDLFKRSDMDYDEYDIMAKPTASASTSSSSANTDTKSMGISLGCINGNCCSSNMIYNSEKNKCVIIPPESFTTLEQNNKMKGECGTCNSKKNNVAMMHEDTTTTPLHPIETTVIPFNGLSFSSLF
jgi:hypothetical protein